MVARHTHHTHQHTRGGQPTCQQKKVRKNRYMRRMQSRHGRLSWGMPFPARLRRSHREHACRLHQSTTTNTRTNSSTRSAEDVVPLEDGRCRCRWRCRLLQEEAKEERGEVVYRPSAAPAPLQRSANCHAQRGRSCEQGASEGGGFSLIGSPFFFRKKTVIGSRPRRLRWTRASCELPPPCICSGDPK